MKNEVFQTWKTIFKKIFKYMFMLINFRLLPVVWYWRRFIWWSFDDWWSQNDVTSINMDYVYRFCLTSMKLDKIESRLTLNSTNKCFWWWITTFWWNNEDIWWKIDVLWSVDVFLMMNKWRWCFFDEEQVTLMKNRWC